MDHREQLISKLLNNESFLKWLSGKGNASDDLYWQNWISESPLHENVFREISEIWSGIKFQQASTEDIDAEWIKLSRRLKLDAPAAAAAGASSTYYQRRLEREIRATRRWLGLGSAIAAAICVVALVWITFFDGFSTEPAEQVVHTGFGEQLRIQLPDQSVVILNANSTLRYPADWAAGSALAVQLHGEAFFDIVSEPQGRSRPFTVRTADGQVNVLGTRFVVYERGAGTQVSLEKGRVEVASMNDQRNVLARTALLPGQYALFHRNDQQLHARQVSGKSLIVWWENNRVFELDRTPLSVLIRRIEETYGVSVQVNDPALQSRELSGAIENASIDVVLDALGKVLQIPVTRVDDRVILN